MGSLASIQAKCLQIHHRFIEIESQEKDALKAIFENPCYFPLRQQIENLGGQVSQLDPKHPEQLEIQQIWNKTVEKGKPVNASALMTLLQTIHEIAKRNPFTRFIPPDNPFYGTNLVVYRHYYAGALPPNGIREDDFQEFTRLYQRIKDNKTNMKLVGTDGERGELLQIIKTLLTTKTGRALIQDLCSRKYRNEPFPVSFDELSGAKDKSQGGLSITISPKRETFIAQHPDGSWISEKGSAAITLGHELIHMRHILHHELFPFDNAKEVQPEELRTMFGAAEGAPFDPINENALRNELGHLMRVSYQSGVPEEIPLEHRLGVAARNNIQGDLPQLLASIKSLSDLEKCLSVAAEHGNIEILKSLEQLFERFHATAQERQSSLLKALNNANVPLKLFQWILERIQDPHSAQTPPLTVHVQDIYKIRALLARGLDPDQKDGSGRTALDHLEKSPLPYEQKLRILQLFFEKGARIPPTYLKEALQNGDETLAKKIRAQNPDVIFRTPATKTNLGCLPLCDLSAYELRLHLLESLEKPATVGDILKEMRQRNVSLHFTNHLGETPLHVAARWPINDQVFEQLLVEGAALNTQSWETLSTPLHVACQQQDALKVLLLLEHHVDQTIKDISSNLPWTDSCQVLDILATEQLMNNKDSPILGAMFQRRTTALAIASYAQDAYPYLKQAVLKNKLRAAIQSDDVESLKLLFANGAALLDEAKLWVHQSQNPEILKLWQMHQPHPVQTMESAP